jgi:transposase-like protein
MNIPENFWNDIINKELEKYNVTYQELVNKYLTIDESGFKSIKINSIDWFQYYTFDTQQEYNSWEIWVKEYIKKNIKPKLSKTSINECFMWVNFSIGLKLNF